MDQAASEEDEENRKETKDSVESASLVWGSVPVGRTTFRVELNLAIAGIQDEFTLLT